MKVIIYTDGACSGNPGKGGWGAILRYGDKLKEISGSENETTNNRMELTAAIEALKCLKKSCDIELYTDSKYVMDGLNNWLEGWKANGWKTASKSPVKNKDLWELLDIEAKKHNINWFWVKGHSNHPENDRADELARTAIK